MLKKIWPTPYKIKKGDLISFLVQLIIFAVVIIVASFLIKILAALPIIGILAWVLGGVLDVYSVVGVVLCILKFLGIVK
jgi:hypothetical protein